jgi:DNA-binding MarR family transcriptional regulator
MADHENCILFLLSKAHQRAYGIFKRFLQPYGLTPVQLLVIMALEQDEGISAGELGKKLMLDNATLSGVLDRMAENGWVTKEPAEGDKRVLRIALAPRSRPLLEDLNRDKDRANDEVLSVLPLEEKALMRRMLKDMQ